MLGRKMQGPQASFVSQWCVVFLTGAFTAGCVHCSGGMPKGRSAVPGSNPSGWSGSYRALRLLPSGLRPSRWASLKPPLFLPLRAVHRQYATMLPTSERSWLLGAVFRRSALRKVLSMVCQLLCLCSGLSGDQAVRVTQQFQPLPWGASQAAT